MDVCTVITAAKWIGTWLIEEGKYLYGVQDQVQHLHDELECMVGLLQDSDEAQLVDQEGNRQLAIYVKKIRQIAFQAEDVIDTYILQVASTSQGKSPLTRCACFLSKSPLIYQTGNQIEAIIKDAKEANDRLNRYKVVAKSTNDGSSNTTKNRPIMLETYAHTEDEIVVGFDDHIQTLVKQLKDENNSWVVGIVGTVGGGKSTLARKVYNHIDVSSYFKYRAWVSISQQWNRRDLLYEILRNTRGIHSESERNRNWSNRELVETIYDFLKDQCYLLVLDDTWETKAWDEIRDALPPRRKGSKVIITTRLQEVPSYAEANCFVLEPQLLDKQESWELFSKIALDGLTAASSDITRFEHLGKEMVAKCGGLPLAIVTLAGILRAKQALDDWKNINKACGDNILEHRRVDKIIALSYFNLPSHLKPCFLYLGIFPEDTQISGGLLTQLWIAEGLVTKDQQRRREMLEDVAKRCLDELVKRCILQVARRNHAGAAKWYRLHDLLRDFCIVKAKDQRFLEVFSPMDQSELDAKVSTLQARRATFHSGISLTTQNPNLRSLIRFGNSGPHIVGNLYNYEMVRTSMAPVHKNFKLLRVLNLWGIETTNKKLSKEIGNLIHLRYLAIKATNITMFPKAIGNLSNLLTLDLGSNKGEGKISFTLSKMTRIRYLCLGFRNYISTENLGLYNLQELQKVKAIEAGKWIISEMDRLSRGIRKLEIYHLSRMEQLSAVYRCPSIMFDSVQSLYLDWLNDENLKLDLEKLENCQHLRKLTLDGRINEDNSIAKPLRFPPNIVHLEVWRSHLQRQDWITSLAQLPSLKFLRLGPDSYEGTQLILREGSFPRLNLLMLHCLENLEEWRIEEGALALVERLGIYDCPKLQRLAEGLRGITTLQTLAIAGMPPTFCKRLGWKEDDGAKKITIRNNSNDRSTGIATEDGEGSSKRSGEDLHIIQHVLTITIEHTG